MKRISYLSILGLAVSAFHFGSIPYASADESTERVGGPLYDELVSVGSVPSEHLDANFQVGRANPELGRAWVEISVYTPPLGSPDNAGETRIIKKKVAGLKYNPSNQEIILEQNGANPVVCAKLVQKHFLFFSADSVEETGNCKLSASLEARNVDDGLEIKKAYYGTVSLKAVGSGTGTTEK